MYPSIFILTNRRYSDILLGNIELTKFFPVVSIFFHVMDIFLVFCSSISVLYNGLETFVLLCNLTAYLYCRGYLYDCIRKSS